MWLILAAALAVRLLGVGRALPYIHEWDEPSVLSYVVGMLQRGDLYPNVFVYPSVYYYMLLPVVYLHYWYQHATGVLASPWQIVLYHPQVASNAYWWYLSPASFYYSARALTALFGAATVYLVYRLGRTAYGPATGLLAAALLAVAPGAVYYSDTVRVDIPMTFMLMLTVLVGLTILRRGRTSDYAFTGLLAGLAISTKPNAGVVVLSLLAAHLLSARRPRVIDWRVVLMGLCTAGGALLGTPYALATPSGPLGLLGGSIQTYGRMSLGMLPLGLGQYLTYLIRPFQFGLWFLVPHTALGAIPGVAALAGAVAGCFARPRAVHLYLLSFPVPYLLFMAAHVYLTPQSMMPVLPFAALFAALAAVRAWQALAGRLPAPRPRWAPALAALGLVVLLAAPARESVALGWMMGRRPDTRTAAVQWLRRHVTPGARVAFDEHLRWYLPDLDRLPFAIRFAPSNAPAGWYLERHIDYAAIQRRPPVPNLPVVATFLPPAYEHRGPAEEWSEDTAILDPTITIVAPAMPENAAVFPISIPAPAMYNAAIVERGPGVYAETVRLPDQLFPPGAYVLNLVTEPWARFWTASGETLTQVTATVLVGGRTVGDVTVNETPLRYTAPAFRIDRTQTLPIEIRLLFRTQPPKTPERQVAAEWALRPSPNGCAGAPDASSLNPEQLTVEAWVYPEALNMPPGGMRSGLESEAPILNKWQHLGYSLRLVGDDAGRIFADLSAAGKFSVGRAGYVPLRAWTHVAATYDGHDAAIYVNGSPQAPVRSPHHDGRIRAEGAPLVIGCRDARSPDTATFHGLIAGVRVWNRVLSLDEIRRDASLRWLPDTTPGLVGSWAFRSEAGDQVPDLSGSGNNLHGPHLRLVAVTSGPLAAPAWAVTRRSPIETVTIGRVGTVRRVAFPVTLQIRDVFPGPTISAAPTKTTETLRVNQEFVPGAYTVSIVTAPPRSRRTPGTITARISVGGRLVGTATAAADRPLTFTTPAFHVAGAETLPIEVAVTGPSAPAALHPPDNGCAIARSTGDANPSQFTLSAWVYPEAMNEPPEMRARGLESENPIVSRGNQRGYYLRLVGDLANRIFADLSVAGKFSVGRGGFVPLSKWTHIAATYDGRQARIYVNGTPQPPERTPAHAGVVDVQGAPLVIGCRDPGTADQLVFAGFIGRVRIWNKVLQPDLIRDDAGTGPASPAALAGAWSFDSLVNGTVADQSGANHALTVGSLQTLPGNVRLPAGLAAATGAAGEQVSLLQTVTIRQIPR